MSDVLFKMDVIEFAKKPSRGQYVIEDIQPSVIDIWNLISRTRKTVKLDNARKLGLRVVTPCTDRAQFLIPCATGQRRVAGKQVMPVMLGKIVIIFRNGKTVKIPSWITLYSNSSDTLVDWVEGNGYSADPTDLYWCRRGKEEALLYLRDSHDITLANLAWETIVPCVKNF